MNKFIPCENGSFVSINFIVGFDIQHNLYQGKFSVRALTENLDFCLASNFENEKEAYEWLDKFMHNQALLNQKTTTQRCF